MVIFQGMATGKERVNFSFTISLPHGMINFNYV
jgi:hypothetical protein